MIQIDDKIISFEVLEQYFACDYAVCRGACCVKGDAGPPAVLRECREIEQHMRELLPNLSPEARQVIHDQGVSYIDPTGERVLSIVHGEHCAFTLHPEPTDGVRCAIEWCREQPGSRMVQKPISCRLYPIRVNQFRHFSTLVYDRWDICEAAVKRGRELGIKVYQFVRQPLIDAFGEEFYSQLEEADRLLQAEREAETKKNSREATM